jgi:C-terminal processing protease CtpA/Prc
VVVDEFQRVGFELGAGSGAHRYVIGALYAGTDADRKMLRKGDEIVSIDGTALDPLDSVTADDMLNGMVGATHAVGLGVAATAGLSNTTVDVLIEDLIPPPQ